MTDGILIGTGIGVLTTIVLGGIMYFLIQLLLERNLYTVKRSLDKLNNEVKTGFDHLDESEVFTGELDSTIEFDPAIYDGMYLVLEDMIHYSNYRNYQKSNRKYYHGSCIKKIMKLTLEEFEKKNLDHLGVLSKNNIEGFYSRYITSEHPISDVKLYSLGWKGEGMDELGCFSKPLENNNRKEIS